MAITSRVMGLFSLAALALLTLSAPAAWAGGKLKSDGPFVMVGSEGGGAGAFTYPGEEAVECPESSFAAEAVGGGALKESGETVFTVNPIYNNSKCHTSPNNRKVTVLGNGCHYIIHIGETEAADRYLSTVDLSCPAGKSFEILVFNASNNENIKICTITVKEQKGFTGPALISETSNGDIRMEGTFEGISASKAGLCGAGSTMVAKRDISVTFRGTRPAEEVETTVSIVD